MAVDSHRRALTVWALDGIPEVTEGDDLASLIIHAAGVDGLSTGDILLVTSKIVSKAEGRTRAASEREEAIDSETVRAVATRTHARGRTRIVENRLGIIGAAAGVDTSNAPLGTILLLPVDPDASARRIARSIRSRGIEVGVIVTDTLGRPWREGQTDIAIGAAGVAVFAEMRGERDVAGRELTVTRPCLGDELAGAGDLVKGKTAGTPVAVLRGASHLVGPLDLPGARTIVRPANHDMFRYGSDEAFAAGFLAGLEASARTTATDDREQDRC